MRRKNDDLIGADGETGAEQVSLRTSDVYTVVQGVSLPWLMKAFRMGRGTIEKKLRGCPTVGQGKHGTPLYDLPEAASYLARPKIDLNEYLKSVKPDELPERLREAYWNAKLKSQRWEEKAGQLWRTERVLTVFGDVLQSMRTKLQLVPDRIERASGLTSEQHEITRTVIDEVQDEMYQELLSVAQTGRTPNQLGEDQQGRRDNGDLV